MNDVFLFNLLSTSLTVNSYPGYVPEDVTLPAISYTHIASPFARVLSGSKTNKSDTWRLILVSETADQLNTLVNELETLDNTSNTDYHKIFVILVKKNPKDSDDQDYYTAIVDLETYEG